MAEAKEGAPSLTGKDANLIFPCAGSITNDTPRHLYFPDVALHLSPNISGENTSRATFPSVGHWLRFHSDIEQLSVLNEWVDAFQIVIDAEFVLDHIASAEPVSMELVAGDPAPAVAAEAASAPTDPAATAVVEQVAQEQDGKQEDAKPEPVATADEASTPTGDGMTEGDTTDASASSKAAAAKSVAKSKK